MPLNLLQPRLSTTTPLAGNATYTSAAQHSTLNASRICVVAYSDVAGTVYVEQSIDGTNWDLISSAAVSAATGLGFEVALMASYWRTRYLNGATPQATFRLQASLRALS